MSAPSAIPSRSTTPADSPRWWLVLAAVAVGAIGFAIYLRILLTDPEVRLLVPEHGAKWIRRERPYRLAAFGPTQEVVLFEKLVTVPPKPMLHILTVRGYRRCRVFLDREEIFQSGGDWQAWKQAYQIPLPNLTPGEHSIGVMTENGLGPTAALVYCDSLGLVSDRTWQEFNKEWLPVGTVDEVELPEVSRQFPSPPAALSKTLIWLGPVFLAVWGFLYWQGGRTADAVATRWWSAGRCRWIVMAALLILAANNFLKLNLGLGYDVDGHIDYIKFIADRAALPDARNGVQMFQAPLYYVLSAALYRACGALMSADATLHWIRWVPLLCGIAQVEICYRAARSVFPERDELQCLAVLSGGLLPMNVYMSQVASNEPLCAALSSLVLLMCWQTIHRESLAREKRWQIQLGLVLGLAMLTKMSAVLLLVPAAVVLTWLNRKAGIIAIAKGWGRCFGTAAALSGWYYFRNWLIFGKPFVGGWDPATEIIWWQDPGYRTPRQLLSFGQSLFAPIHAGFYSIWDGFFATLWLDGNLSAAGSWDSRPPWNDTLMLAAPWLAMVLTIAIGAGLLRAVWNRDPDLRHSLQLAGGTLLLYLAFFVILCAQVPIFSQAKASYTLGLLPAYAVLCVAGLDLLPRWRILRTAAAAFVVSWSLLVYATYFVR